MFLVKKEWNLSNLLPRSLALFSPFYLITGYTTDYRATFKGTASNYLGYGRVAGLLTEYNLLLGLFYFYKLLYFGILEGVSILLTWSIFSERGYIFRSLKALLS